MTPETLVELGRHALQTAILVAAPILLVALGVGLVIGVLQAATQIQESTLSFIPKLLGILVALGIAGPWMLTHLIDYTQSLVQGIPGLLG